MIDHLMGYTVHWAAELRPNTILFTKGNETITVSMLQEALEHMIFAIAKRNPIFKQYSIKSVAGNSREISQWTATEAKQERL